MITGVVQVQLTARVASTEYTVALALIVFARIVSFTKVNHSISVRTTVYAPDAA